MSSGRFEEIRILPAPPSPSSNGKPLGRLGELAFLAGGTWVSLEEGGSLEESFAWDAGMQSLRTMMVRKVNGAIVAMGQGLFTWDATAERLMSASFLSGTYFSSRELTPSAPDRWRWLCTSIGQGASEVEALMVRIDENTFEMSFRGVPPRVYRREPPV